MDESLHDILAREAREAREAARGREAKGESTPGGQRARRQPVDPSQVYSIRIPVSRLEELRELAESRGVPPTALLRQFVIERLDQESTPVVAVMPERDPNELRLGPARSAPVAAVFEFPARRQA